MRRLLGAVAIVLFICVVALPAAAQAKDPFQPAPGAGPQAPPGTGPRTPGGPAVGGVPPAPPQSGGLPRTGLNYSLPLIAALGLIAAGASLRLAGSALGG